MTERDDRLLAALEAFATREVEELRATTREIRHALHGRGDEPGLVQLVRFEIAPQVARHKKTLYGENGEEGLVLRVHDNRQFIQTLRRLAWVVTSAVVVQTAIFVAWLVRTVLAGSG